MNRKQQVTFVVAANTNWQIVEAVDLLTDGLLVRASYRLGTEGSPVGGDLDIKVLDGGYNASMTSAAIAAVPNGDAAYSESAITLASSATTTTETNIVNAVGDTAVYDRRGATTASYAQEDRGIFIAVKGDGTLVGTVTVTLRARDVNR